MTCCKSKMMLFRYKSFKKYDFIEEHRRVIDDCGYTWILKMGQQVPDKSIKDIIKASGVLLLRAPKAEGGKLYACKIVDFLSGVVNDI